MRCTILNGKITIAVEYRCDIVHIGARVHYGERTTPKQLEELGILSRFRREPELLHLALVTAPPKLHGG